MSTIPNELHYTKSHEWVRVEEELVTIGITEHAQQLLGDMVFVELPSEGEDVKSGDEIGVVESVKAASDFYAPVSGEIVAVNEELSDSPALVNSDPYGDGWLVQIKLSDKAELNDLLNAESYGEIVSEEQ